MVFWEGKMALSDTRVRAAKGAEKEYKGLYPINGGRASIRTRLIMPSHPQWVSTLSR